MVEWSCANTSSVFLFFLDSAIQWGILVRLIRKSPATILSLIGDLNTFIFYIFGFKEIWFQRAVDLILIGACPQVSSLKLLAGTQWWFSRTVITHGFKIGFLNGLHNFLGVAISIRRRYEIFDAWFSRFPRAHTIKSQSWFTRWSHTVIPLLNNSPLGFLSSKPSLFPFQSRNLKSFFESPKSCHRIFLSFPDKSLLFLLFKNKDFFFALLFESHLLNKALFIFQGFANDLHIGVHAVFAALFEIAEDYGRFLVALWFGVKAHVSHNNCWRSSDTRFTVDKNLTMIFEWLIKHLTNFEQLLRHLLKRALFGEL